MDYFDLKTLQVMWYAVFLASMFAYAVLDGFDIGVGCLLPFVKKDKERRIFLNAIGPVWDGNSLWVIITSGCLFAGFPSAFALLFSTLYTPMMLLVFGFVLRPAAIEFRSKVTNLRWHKVWDAAFSIASYMIAFGLGITLANLISGLPINTMGIYEGSLLDLITLYSVTVGIYITLLLMVHGGLYLNMKTEGMLQERVQKILYNLLTLFVAFWAIITHMTLVFAPNVADIIRSSNLFFINEIVAICGLAAIVTNLRKGNAGRAFLSSFIFIASQVANFALGTFPYIVRSTLTDSASMTIYNSSASDLTMHILLGIALLGIPLIVFYGLYTYRVFRGKVTLDSMSY